MTALSQTALVEELFYELLRTRFPPFFEMVFRTLNPGATYQPAEYLRVIAHHLELVERGDIKRLLVTVPPRHGKSQMISVAWTAWQLGRDPAKRIIAASYGLDLAHHLSIQTRRVMEADWYRRVFPNTLDLKVGAKDELRTRKYGYRYATSVGGTLTGRGGDVLIVDDPLSADDAFSAASRDRAWEWFTGTLMSRLDDPKAGAIVVVSQRLHMEDIPGRLIAGGGYTHVNLPAIAWMRQEYPITDDVIWSRDPGDLLHAERLGPKEIERLQQELAPEVWEAQYMQRPSPPGGAIFKLAEFRRYAIAPKRSFFEAVIASVDTGLSTSTTANFTAATVWGIYGQDVYLLHAERGRLGFNDQIALVDRLAKDYRLNRVIIEKAASGYLLIDELRRQGAKGILHYNPKDDKIARAHAATAKIHKGVVYLPQHAPWLEPFLLEAAMFPNGKNDDWVDSMTQFLRSLDYGISDLGLSIYGGPQINAYLLGA